MASWSVRGQHRRLARGGGGGERAAGNKKHEAPQRDFTKHSASDSNAQTYRAQVYAPYLAFSKECLVASFYEVQFWVE